MFKIISNIIDKKVLEDNIDINNNFLMMLNSTNGIQMMGFIFVYNKKVILIDGGQDADFEQIEYIISKLGNHVDYMILTHLHADHFGPLTKLLNEHSFDFDYFICNFPSFEETSRVTQSYEIGKLNSFYKEYLRIDKKKIFVAHKDDIITLDGFKIVFLNETIKNNLKDVNDSSLCFKIMINGGESILFLGDLSPTASIMFASEYTNSNKLEADFVQLAHHGQEGGAFELYELTKLKYALWCSPRWLYDNDVGGGYNTGPYTIAKTKEWMKILKAESITAIEGPTIIKFE